MVYKHAYDDVIGEAIAIISVVQVSFKRIVLTIEINKAAAVGAYPDVTFGVLYKTIYVAKAKAMRVGNRVGEMMCVERELDYTLMVIAHAFFIGAHPYYTAVILI